jgi:hypothetical protein
VVPWTDADTTTTTDINDAGVAINGDVISGFTFTISDAVKTRPALDRAQRRCVPARLVGPPVGQHLTSTRR